MRCINCGTIHHGAGPCCCVTCEIEVTKRQHTFGAVARGPRIEIPSAIMEECCAWVPRAER